MPGLTTIIASKRPIVRINLHIQVQSLMGGVRFYHLLSKFALHLGVGALSSSTLNLIVTHRCLMQRRNWGSWRRLHRWSLLKLRPPLILQPHAPALLWCRTPSLNRMHVGLPDPSSPFRHYRSLNDISVHRLPLRQNISQEAQFPWDPLNPLATTHGIAVF
jgi:hypothetical protein